MNCLDVVFEVIQTSQEITKMTADGMPTDKACLAFLMPQVNVLNMIHHVRNTLEFSHTRFMR
jgi:hypothetical protein